MNSLPPVPNRLVGGSTILLSYLTVAATLTALALRAIIQQARRPRPSPSLLPQPSYIGAKLVFSILAIVSLVTTWYHMFAFFDWSYLRFVASSPLNTITNTLTSMPPTVWDVLKPSGTPERARIEAWLADTQLFAQAWGAALDSMARAWWTLQIFPFATAMGLWLGLQGGKRRNFGAINLASFTMLGFLVAISFALNLAFLAMLFAPTPIDTRREKEADRDTKMEDEEEKDEYGENPNEKYYIDPINAGQSIPEISVYTIVGLVHFLYDAAMRPISKGFLIPLTLLHLNVANAVRGMARAEFFVRNPQSLQTMAFFSVFATLFPFMARMAVVQDGQEGRGKPGLGLQVLLEALESNPAVSSVGWDVIMCWISIITWGFVGDGS